MAVEQENKDGLSNRIKISVCITTRNRAEFISQALESIISQANDSVEIVIIDGASTDNTTEVVGEFGKRFSNLVYHRCEKNSGVDRDMAKCIELARGEYCWLFSDDDMLKPGAIERMLKEVESGYEIYLCNVTACTLSMQPIADRFWLSVKVKDRGFNLHDSSGLIEYCNAANSIGALFSYWSSIIIRREEWNESGYDYDFDGSAYALASSVISFIKRKCRLKYIRSPLVQWRNDNQSFQMEGGLVKRFLLDFNAYLKLADKYLTDDPNARKAFLRVMIREHPWYTIIHVSSFIDNHKQWKNFSSKLFKFGYSRSIVTICYLLSRPKHLISLGVMIKRRIIRNRWIRKFAEFPCYRRI